MNIQQELDKLNSKVSQAAEQNKVKANDFPKLKKTWEYKKSTVIKSSDLYL